MSTMKAARATIYLKTVTAYWRIKIGTDNYLSPQLVFCAWEYQAALVPDRIENGQYPQERTVAWNPAMPIRAEAIPGGMGIEVQEPAE